MSQKRCFFPCAKNNFKNPSFQIIPKTKKIKAGTLKDVKVPGSILHVPTRDRNVYPLLAIKTVKK